MGAVMKAKDHIRIGITLAGVYGLNGKKKSAFILGNLLPDINIFSYLTREPKNRLRGHSYTYKKHKIERHICRKPMHTARWWLKTGILCHYLADSFTSSHDETQRMSLQNHKQYEKHLHKQFRAELHKLEIRMEAVDQSELIHKLAVMRELYLSRNRSVENDVSMILHALRMVIGTLAQLPPKERKR